MLKKTYLLIFIFALTACTTMKINDFKNTEPKFIPEEYFQGDLIAHGYFQDLFGSIKRRFEVTISGTWNEEKQELTLIEDFLYDDGETEQRIWVVQKHSDGQYTGRADGVVGVAQGQAQGYALNWRYDFDLPYKEGTLRVHFDDWMFLQSDKVMINHAKISKLGIKLGEVVISFNKL